MDPRLLRTQVFLRGLGSTNIIRDRFGSARRKKHGNADRHAFDPPTPLWYRSCSLLMHATHPRAHLRRKPSTAHLVRRVSVLLSHIGTARRLRAESFAHRPSRCDGAVGEAVDDDGVRSVRARPPVPTRVPPVPPFAPIPRDRPEPSRDETVGGMDGRRRLRSRGGGGGGGGVPRLAHELRDDPAPPPPFRPRERVRTVSRARRRFHRR